MQNNLIQIAKSIISSAKAKGFVLKAFGRIGVAISCGLNEIETSDIDLFGSNIKEDLLISFFENNGFPWKTVNPNSITFKSKDKSIKVDVYLNKLEFSFKIPGPFYPSNKYTIPITQLFLSKLYFSDDDWEEKNKQDLISILRSHPIGKSKDCNTIQLGLLQKIWCCNPDSHSIFSFCEKKLIELIEYCDDDDVKTKIEYILGVIRKTPKNCPYKFGKCIHYGAPNIVEDAFDPDSIDDSSV